MTPIRVLRTLFQVRDQAHFLHLKTTSYAEHKALDEFYEGWLDLADSFVEPYQGKYGRIEGAETIEINGSANLNAFLSSTMEFLNKEIVTLFDKTAKYHRIHVQRLLLKYLPPFSMKQLGRALVRLTSD